MREEDIIGVIVKNAFKGGKILEVGSGGGWMAIEIAQRTGCIVYGVDSSHFATVRARARARARGLSDKAVFETQRAESLSFPREFFDLVYTVKTLHETRTVGALREMHRVLKNGGKIILIDWVKGAKTWVHERYFTPEELEAMVKLSGFKSASLEVLNDVMLLIAEKCSREPEAQN